MTGAWISLWAAPAAIGFALYFNVRRRTLVPIALLAIMAHALRGALDAVGWGLVEASFVAALSTGLIAYTLGPATGEASPVYAFAPVIPLVPGTLLFDGLAAFGQLIGGPETDVDSARLLTLAGQDVLTAGAVILALAIGSTAPSLLRPTSRTGT